MIKNKLLVGRKLIDQEYGNLSAEKVVNDGRRKGVCQIDRRPVAVGELPTDFFDVRFGVRLPAREDISSCGPRTLFLDAEDDDATPRI